MPDEAPPETFPDGFVPIAFVYSRPEATVIAATLRAYGIAAFVRNEGHIAVQTPLLVALGGLCVAVAPHQLDDAIALLHAIDEGWTRPASPLALWGRVSPLTALLAFFLLLVSPPPRIRGEYLWRIREDRAYSAR